MLFSDEESFELAKSGMHAGDKKKEYRNLEAWKKSGAPDIS
jgi:hypothetical protein